MVADSQVGADARVAADRLASYDCDNLGERPCERIVQSKGGAARERRPAGLTLDDLDPEALAHGHACARGHPSTYRPTSTSSPSATTGTRPTLSGRIAARVIERLLAREPLTMRSLIDDTKRCRWFRSAQPAERKG